MTTTTTSTITTRKIIEKLTEKKTMFMAHEPESYAKIKQQPQPHQQQQRNKHIFHLIKYLWKIVFILASLNYFITKNQLLQNIHAFGIDQQQQQPQQNAQHKISSTVTPETIETDEDSYEDIIDNQLAGADVDDNNKKDDEAVDRPEEIQKAVCTVTAGEVRASAEAITTKQLKGVCGSAELRLALEKLEARISNELYALRSLLLQHLEQHIPKIGTTEKTFDGQNSKKNKPIIKTDTTTTTPAATTALPKNILAKVEEPIRTNNYKIPQMKSLNENHFHRNNNNNEKQQLEEKYKLQRQDEVDKFNNTLLADRDIKLFTYYWKLENFTAHIESAKMQQIESPIFSIKGKPLQIKAYFHHLQRDFLYLQLQYATKNMSKSTTENKPHTHSNNNNNIIMEMGMASGAVNGGSLFKEIISNNKILFKHKISILDQHNELSKDLVSQEFNNLDNGFLVPNSALLGTSPYIKQHALLIQLYLYL